MSVKPRVRFEMSFFVPGIRVPFVKTYKGRVISSGLGPPKPLAKGSLEPWKRPNGSTAMRNGRTIPADKPEVYKWVTEIARAAILVRNQLIASGYDPFPYRGDVLVTPLFIYERPATQRKGKPTHHTDQHDLDKLQRAVGDALGMTRKAPYPRAEVILDDKRITGWTKVYKRFIDQVDWHHVKPAAGVFFKIEEDPDDPIDIREYL